MQVGAAFRPVADDVTLPVFELLNES